MLVCSGVHCGVVWCCVVLCGIVWCCVGCVVSCGAHGVVVVGIVVGIVVGSLVCIARGVAVGIVIGGSSALVRVLASVLKCGVFGVPEWWSSRCCARGVLGVFVGYSIFHTSYYPSSILRDRDNEFLGGFIIK